MSNSSEGHDMLNIDHRDGSRVVAITGIEHATYQGRAHWHFKGTLKKDGAPARANADISPVCLAVPAGGDRGDLDRAQAALAEYMRINGDWDEQGDWVPHRKSGYADINL